MQTELSKDNHPYRDENGFMRFGNTNRYNSLNQINASVVFMPILETNKVPEYLDFQQNWANLASYAAGQLLGKFPGVSAGVDFEINRIPIYKNIRYGRKKFEAIPLLVTIGNPADEYHILSTLGFEMMTGLGLEEFFEQFQNLYPVPWYTEPEKHPSDSDMGFLEDLIITETRSMFIDAEKNSIPSIEKHKHGLISNLSARCQIDLLVFRRSLTIVEGKVE